MLDDSKGTFTASTFLTGAKGPGYPEAFNVLVKELQALGLDVRLIEE